VAVRHAAPDTELVTLLPAKRDQNVAAELVRPVIEERERSRSLKVALRGGIEQSRGEFLDGLPRSRVPRTMTLEEMH